MALARPLPPLWQTLLPGLNGAARPVLNLPLLQRLAQPFRMLPTPFAALAIPLSLPSIPSLSDIWDGLLNAVPKKKTSYMKKRTRFMAGKGLKDLTNLNKCSACGRVKRAHFLCPYCVDGKFPGIIFPAGSSCLTLNAAIKSNIFGQHWWSVRMPTRKQEKQLKRQKREELMRSRMVMPDPRENKPIVEHTTWSKK
ncbi:meiotic recombination protein ski8 [Paraphaeosphaeria minitans]|uniref:Large ribosomal subunit protein bL32m n=1 Tax=Paraphaeosphaeria minitans TaxID=565426 RepID=A0A9P6GNU5_9PLEO|nr:meiotic recombination protein ski8 [Paraphaeosphaeria minitans]